MTLIAIILLAYLFVAPDKGTLVATRGTEGALRAAFGMLPRQRRAAAEGSSRKGSTRKGSRGSTVTGSPGASGSRSLLDGWREGVASARQAREEGRDVWSRTSRVSGRVAGGTRNLATGIRTTLNNQRARRNRAATDTTATETEIQDEAPVGPSGQQPQAPGGGTLFTSSIDDLGGATGVKTPEASEAPGQGSTTVSKCRRCGERRFNGFDLLCQPCRLANWDAVWKLENAWQQDPIQRSGPCRRCGANRLLSPDGCGLCAPCAHDQQHSKEAPSPPEAPAAPDSAPVADDSEGGGEHNPTTRYITWEDPDGGRVWVLDRQDIDSPMGPYSKDEATKIADFFNDADVAELVDADTTQTPVAAPATDNPGTTARKETAMAIAGSELANLDEVAGEVKAATAEVEQLGVALDALKSWAANLTDRWSGTSWSTDGLDASIGGVAEAAAELKRPDGVMDQLASINNEITKARSVGEAAEAARAKGDLKGFIPA